MVMGEREMCGFTQLFLILSFYLSKKKEEKCVVGEAVMEYWERANNITVEE